MLWNPNDTRVWCGRYFNVSWMAQFLNWDSDIAGWLVIWSSMVSWNNLCVLVKSFYWSMMSISIGGVELLSVVWVSWVGIVSDWGGNKGVLIDRILSKDIGV